jgi:hypothetical protein
MDIDSRKSNTLKMLWRLSNFVSAVRLNAGAGAILTFIREYIMQYLLLIYESEQNWAKLNEAEAGGIMREYGAFTQSIATSGHYKGGNPLQPTKTATTVRVRNGKRQTIDGPFAETREQLGGYYLIDAKDLDEATQIAERIPAARTGSIEVRPIMPMSASMQS